MNPKITLLRDNKIDYVRFVAIQIDGKRLEIPSKSSIIIAAGPGPANVTVTLLCSEVNIIDV